MRQALAVSTYCENFYKVFPQLFYTIYLVQENPAPQAEENDAHDRQGRQVMAQRGQMAGQEEFADGVGHPGHGKGLGDDLGHWVHAFQGPRIAAEDEGRHGVHDGHPDELQFVVENG